MDGYFETKIGFSDMYFLNYWIFWKDFITIFMSNLQFERGMGKNFVKNQPWLSTSVDNMILSYTIYVKDGTRGT